MPNPRTPTVLKALRGTERRDRANPAEPTPPAMSVGTKPPAWVETPKAKQAWTAIIEVAPAGLITQMDAMSLGLLVDAFSDWLEARAVLKREGRYYHTTGKDGTTMVRSHPAGSDESDAWKRIRLVLKDFGMTPADRARVSAGSGEEVDPTEAFLGSARAG